MNATAKAISSNPAPVDVTREASWYGIGGRACRLTRRAYETLRFAESAQDGLLALHQLLFSTWEAIQQPAFIAARGYVAWTASTGTAYQATVQLEDCSLLIDLAVPDGAAPALRLAA